MPFWNSETEVQDPAQNYTATISAAGHLPVERRSRPPHPEPLLLVERTASSIRQLLRDTSVDNGGRLATFNALFITRPWYGSLLGRTTYDADENTSRTISYVQNFAMTLFAAS